jgi:hypothetical protein
VTSGRAIGDVARLERGELEALVGPAVPHATRAAYARRRRDARAGPCGLERFDHAALGRCLGDALMAFGARNFVERVAAPLLTEWATAGATAGCRWRTSTSSPG